MTRVLWEVLSSEQGLEIVSVIALNLFEYAKHDDRMKDELESIKIDRSMEVRLSVRCFP